MKEIRFHGRGGQGTVVASIVLAKAIFRAGYYIQSFPVFGVERRGAPVEAYLRYDTGRILIRSSVYTPDHVVVLDQRLLDHVEVSQGLKPGGWILINSPDGFDARGRFGGFKVACVDASGIASGMGLGTRTLPMINTAMLGAFARLLELPAMDILAETIAEEIQVKTDLNVEAARSAYNTVRYNDHE